MIGKGYIDWNGNGAGTTFTVELHGLTIDDSKLPAAATTNNHLGAATWFDNGTGFKVLTVKKSTSSNATGLIFSEIGANNLWDGSQAASGDILFFDFDLPIVEWKQTSLISTTENVFKNTMITRRQASDQTLPNGIYTPVDFDTLMQTQGNGVEYQSGAGYNSGTGTYTTNPGYLVKQSGWYEFSGKANVFSMTADTGELISRIVVTGESFTPLGDREDITGGEQSIRASRLVYVEKDTLVEFHVLQSNGTSRDLRSSSGTVFEVNAVKDTSVF
jgi:hypothetical protein